MHLSSDSVPIRHLTHRKLLSSTYKDCMIYLSFQSCVISQIRKLHSSLLNSPLAFSLSTITKTLKASELKEPPSDEPDRRPSSLTLGRSSDLTHSADGNERGRTPHCNTCLLSQRVSRASDPSLRGNSDSPLRHAINVPVPPCPHAAVPPPLACLVPPPPLSQSDEEEPDRSTFCHPRHSLPHSSPPAAPERLEDPCNISSPTRDPSPAPRQASRSSERSSPRGQDAWDPSSRSQSPFEQSRRRCGWCYGQNLEGEGTSGSRHNQDFGPIPPVGAL
ncbi:hypothetical protein RhiJN_23028 [Ceratobasidium sp. AG-Ba]|nr:hypothetical protein RhiJN_23028 [Ceratobasidium sp. AG-Ba]